jgi:hypothetical protein
MATTKVMQDEPTTYDEAMASPHKASWLAAMREEIESLSEARTWVLEDVPPSRKTVSCKLVFKLKYNLDGSIQRFKARLIDVVLRNRKESTTTKHTVRW